MTTPRVPLFGALLLAGLLGCGGGADPAPTPPPTPVPPPPPAPAPPADRYEMDPAKHAPPAAPATGRLGGKPFTPDRVELQGGTLTFRQGKDFFADSELVLTLKEKANGSAEGTRLVVAPATKWHAGDVPALSTSSRKGEGLPDTQFVTDGYALTLELGTKAGGKVPGKIHLSLPGADRGHLAGTFEAAWVRPVGAPPTADDAPFVAGTVSHPAAKGQMLTVGYVALTGTDVVSDSVGSGVPGPGEGGGWVQSTTSKPRVATLRFDKEAAKFEFVKLPPGEYLVYARLKDGPAAWDKVPVPAGGQVTKNLKLEAGSGGTVQVTVPADFTGQVRLAPAGLGGADADGLVAGRVAFSLDLGAEAKGGQATVANVPPGKYVLFTTPGTVQPRGTVEVAAGKTAKMEIKAGK